MRLRRVIAEADIRVYEGAWCFEEFPIDQQPVFTSDVARGGIYDYWGCPIELLDDAVAVVEALREADWQSSKRD